MKQSPILATLLAWPLSALVPARADACRITLPPVAAPPGTTLERVEFNLLHAAVSAWDGIPVGWNILIDNDPSWRLHFVGQAVVGAAAIDPAAFDALSLKAEHGSTCATIMGQEPRIRLDLSLPFPSDRTLRRTVPAVVTDP